MRHHRDPRDPFIEGQFDLCGCAESNCHRVLQHGAGAQCKGCGSLTCRICQQQGAGNSICKYCDAFACEVCSNDQAEEGNVGATLAKGCTGCGEPVCSLCMRYEAYTPRFCDSCNILRCSDCETKYGAGGAGYLFCDGCGGEW